ncbi:hypothetical protein FGO68_gene1724 [Halteria grandinella]|nr:hypothetical protein FGO68_gene1724 [Halteria grandinella]
MDLLNRVKEEISQEQGCQLKGYFEINRVPGNFHVSSHAYSDILMALMMEGYSFDFSYKINHLSFGRDEQFKIIQRRFPDQGIMNPLDGFSQLAASEQQGDKQVAKNMNSNFYLIAVPSYFTDAGGSRYQVYQLTQNSFTDYNAQQSVLMFNYELSPITVQYQQTKENFFEFIVYICAIVGGIFTVAGIVDSIIHRSVSSLFKQRIGKLS